MSTQFLKGMVLIVSLYLTSIPKFLKHYNFKLNSSIFIEYTVQSATICLANKADSLVEKILPMLVNVAVNGTLMRGLELNSNLLSAEATFVKQANTASIYRLWSINDRYPAMMRVASGGDAIALEVWAVPAANLSTILLQEPPGLCIGKVLLADGEEVLGVVGEAVLCEGQKEITQWGGWRAYMAARGGK
jgi:hypothetical protein